MQPRQSFLVGLAAAVVVGTLCCLVLAGFRDHLSVATDALVLVVPVVIGVSIGGFRVGVVAVVLGFVAYDFVFIPPYGTLSVGASSNFVALGVYAVVMVLVAIVVARLRRARAEAHAGAEDAQRLFGLSELLVGERPLADLLDVIVKSVRQHFELDTVSLLLPGATARPEAAAASGTLEVAACSGDALSAEELAQIAPAAGVPTRRSLLGSSPSSVLRTATLLAAGRPVGMLALKGRQLDQREQRLLGTFVNHAALALERARLRDQALRTELLEEVDRWRAALVGGVSHDLRTPLASIKAAISDLRDPTLPIAACDRAELLEMVETQADHLTRLVTNLLDFSRLESGGLELRRQPTSVADLVDEAVASLGLGIDPERVTRTIPDDVALLDVDHVLTAQVIANLLENAVRLAPAATAIEVQAGPSGARMVAISVSDAGPGVARADRERIFEIYSRGEGGGRAGLGLAIAKAFVEAHGGSISVGTARLGGACFEVELPALELASTSLLSAEG
jgi:two-component system sensor histidine kinase KdpD